MSQDGQAGWRTTCSFFPPSAGTRLQDEIARSRVIGGHRSTNCESRWEVTVCVCNLFCWYLFVMWCYRLNAGELSRVLIRSQAVNAPILPQIIPSSLGNQIRMNFVASSEMNGCQRFFLPAGGANPENRQWDVCPPAASSSSQSATQCCLSALLVGLFCYHCMTPERFPSESSLL